LNVKNVHVIGRCLFQDLQPSSQQFPEPTGRRRGGDLSRDLNMPGDMSPSALISSDSTFVVDTGNYGRLAVTTDI
jgi:hypothetical protein